MGEKKSPNFSHLFFSLSFYRFDAIRVEYMQRPSFVQPSFLRKQHNKCIFRHDHEHTLVQLIQLGKQNGWPNTIDPHWKKIQQLLANCVRNRAAIESIRARNSGLCIIPGIDLRSILSFHFQYAHKCVYHFNATLIFMKQQSLHISCCLCLTGQIQWQWKQIKFIRL